MPNDYYKRQFGQRESESLDKGDGKGRRNISQSHSPDSLANALQGQCEQAKSYPGQGDHIDTATIKEEREQNKQPEQMSKWPSELGLVLHGHCTVVTLTVRRLNRR